MLYSEKTPSREKLKDKSPRGQVFVGARHEEVQGRGLRGPGNFEWNTDLIETEKLENFSCQVAQYKEEAQHRGLSILKFQHLTEC